MNNFFLSVESLGRSLVEYQDGDILQLTEWLREIAQLRAQAQGSEARTDLSDLEALVRSALSGQGPPDFVERFQGILDRHGGARSPVAPPKSPGEPVSSNTFWQAHGPAFMSETRNRLARAQGLILGMESHPSTEELGELFRIFHSIKGEAGFLGQTEMVNLVHGTEGLLDELRSGAVFWNRGTPDTLLAAIDQIEELLGGGHPGRDRQEEGPPEQMLRIPAAKVDGLSSLVGELLVALENESRSISPAVRKAIRGIQHSALQLRTDSLQGLFGRIHRGARDLGRQLGKPIEVRLGGEELELDRLLITMLEEPLMHLVRNALDHGIEPAAVRAQRGKPSVGRFELNATRKGNRIQIRVGDDGHGLDQEKIWAKACQLGLAEGSPPADPGQVYEYIFRPGFSTAEGVTQVSGRGVGMEIVSKTVKSHHGQVWVQSTPGQGTWVTLSFPLSTAVLEGLVVRWGNRRYIVPIHSARESLRIRSQDLSRAGQGSLVYSLRGRPVPVFSLGRFLGDPDRPGLGGWGVVLETQGGRQVLMVVDEVEAKREVVIRSLGPLCRTVQGISAGTVLQGDRLALVLDVDQVVGVVEGRP